MQTLFAHLWISLLPLASPSPAPDVPGPGEVSYSLSFEIDTATWHVEASFPHTQGPTLDLWIPRWTAGAYHLADYGRFVRDLSATDESGNALDVERDGDSHFVIEAADSERITVRYEAVSISSSVFSNEIIDVESNRITQDYAYVTPVSLFVFSPELIDLPLRLTVELPDGWRAATALIRDDQGRFLAPSYLRFEDSPLFFSPSAITRTFEVEGKPHAVTVQGRDADTADQVADGCRKIVEATSGLMQGLPYERYHFLIGFVPEGGGSGLEHSDSTLILVTKGMSTAHDSHGIWGIVAHEFFHAWTAERIHVEAIHDPDYTRPLETGTIWVNEGFTEYFSRHVLLQAGFLKEQDMIAALAADALQLPGEQHSWTDVSRAAQSWDSLQELMAFAVKNYMQGPRTIFALDLEMRRASGGERGMLDLVRFLMHAYVNQNRGFREGEMIHLASGVAQADLSEFYARYIDGSEQPDLEPLLQVIGYEKTSRGAVPMQDADQAQLAARRDFFSGE